MALLNDLRLYRLVFYNFLGLALNLRFPSHPFVCRNRLFPALGVEKKGARQGAGAVSSGMDGFID